MGTSYVPPKDPNGDRLEQIRVALRGVLGNHIVGRGKEKKIEKAIDDAIVVLRPLLKLAPAPTKGATVMNEAASLGRKRPNSL